MNNYCWMVILLSWLTPTFVSGQVVFGNPKILKADSSKFEVTGAFQFGTEAINPSEVNRYIRDYLTYHGFNKSASLLYTFFPIKHHTLSDFTLYGNTFVNFSLTLVPTKNSRIRLMYEYAWAPKKKESMSFDGIDTDFDLHRNSWGIVFNYYLPLRDFHSIFAGVGIFTHQMTFEECQATTAGLRLEAGYGARLYLMDTDFFLGADFASAPVDNGYSRAPVPPVREIDFSGVSFGVRITPYFGRMKN